MKLVNFLKSLAVPSASEQLAKLDPRLLADIGVSAVYNKADVVRIPLNPMFTWSDPKFVYVS